MSTPPRKRVAISFANLSPELLDLFHQAYPAGYTDAMIRVDKPTGDFFYVVPLETPDTSYMVKVDVKIDAKPEEDLDKGYYSDEDEGGDGEDTLEGAEDVADAGDDD